MTEREAARRAEIEAAAFRVLERVGYKKASMLQIAKEAKASNETLYAWYGNKQALFSTLIVTNAEVVDRTLRGAIADDPSGEDSLVTLGRLLLRFMATEKAIIINRAAVADVQETGLLAQAIETHARQVMLGIIRTFMAGLAESKGYEFDEGIEPATDIYVALLVGELQMQQSLGSVPGLTEEQIDERAHRARDVFGRLYATSAGA